MAEAMPILADTESLAWRPTTAASARRHSSSAMSSSHTFGFTMGRCLDFKGVPHNRLHLAIAHAMGHTGLVRFGNPDYCGDGPLTGLA